MTEEDMHGICDASIRIAEACIGIVESLEHPRHAVNLARPVEALSDLMMRRWRRQRAQLLSAPGLQAFLKTRRAFLMTDNGLPSKEADKPDGDLRARLQQSVEAHINGTAVFGSEPDAREIAAYDRIITGTMGAAAQRMAIDYQITLAKEIGQQAVASYLQDRGFTKLAADIDAVTRDRLAVALTDVFEHGGTYQDAVGALRGAMVDAERADLIARTELADAYNKSMLASAREIPGAKKVWSSDADPCAEICIPNIEQGAIGLDEDFMSGDDAPPGHPRCLCSVSFVLP